MLWGAFLEPKIDQKSIQNEVDFLIDFCMGFKPILGAFWSPGPSRIELSPTRRAYFQKIGVFASGLIFH